MSDASFAAVPSRRDMAVFSFKAQLFCLRRAFREASARPAIGPHGKSARLAAAPAVAEIVSPLWHRSGGLRERDLTLGKIENLRRAVKAIDGIEIPAGGVFSFWRQVGRPNRLRGFVQGRELREGCIIRTVGGGLCQISNGLYEAALAAGFEGRTILFPASSLARKGLYALREAARGLDLEIAVLGRARETTGELWPGLKVREVQSWPAQLAGVVLPALVEHQPRALLRALGLGLPVIATSACGLSEQPGLTLVPEYDVEELRRALKAILPA